MKKLYISGGWGLFITIVPTTDDSHEVEVPDRIAEQLLSVLPKDGALTIPCVGYTHITVGETVNLQAVARKLVACFELRIGYAELEAELRKYACGPGIYQSAMAVSRQFRTGGYTTGYDNMTMAQAVVDGTNVPYGIVRAVTAFEAVTGARLEQYRSSRHGFDVIRVATQMWRESGHESWPDDGHTIIDLAQRFNTSRV